MEKYGFVYIWYDIKRKMYYIGSHWGKEDDGYICSSNRMRKAYKRRPQDFRRRIIQRTLTSPKELLEIEHKWLMLIEDEQLGKKYYNLRKHHFGHWSTDKEKAQSAVEKIANTLREQNSLLTEEERKQKFGYWKGKPSPNKSKKTNKPSWNKGLKGSIPWNKGLKGAQVAWNKGKTDIYSEETKKRMGNATRNKKTGDRCSKETRQKIGQINSIKMKELWQNKEYRKHQSEVHKK